MTSVAEASESQQHLQHLSCYLRYTRACLYFDKGSTIAGVAGVAGVAGWAFRRSLAVLDVPALPTIHFDINTINVRRSFGAFSK